MTFHAAKGDVITETPMHDRVAAACARAVIAQRELNIFTNLRALDAIPTAALDRAKTRPLAALPIVLKDNIDEQGYVTTGGSWAVPPPARASARIVERLEEAGAINIARSNMDEWAAGFRGTNVRYGPVGNPAGQHYATGGSSGGSAAAVAAGVVTAAIGTDTGGSIRIPAALCGVVGFKPTFGRLPVDGVWPLAPSLDHVGIFGADVTTVHEVFRAVDDVQSVDDTTSRARTVGVIAGAALGLVDPAVVRALAQVRAACERLGWATVDAQLPEADLVIRTHRVIATSEIYRVFAARSWADSGRFGPDLSTLIADGSQHSQQDLLDANVQRAQLVGAIDGLFADCDLLVVPACAAGAPRIGEDFVEVGGQRDTRRSALMRFICLYNMTGHPAVSLPVGATDDGRPIGVQLVGRTGADVPLLVAAAALEAAVVNQ